MRGRKWSFSWRDQQGSGVQTGQTDGNSPGLHPDLCPGSGGSLEFFLADSAAGVPASAPVAAGDCGTVPL